MNDFWKWMVLKEYADNHKCIYKIYIDGSCSYIYPDEIMLIGYKQEYLKEHGKDWLTLRCTDLEEYNKWLESKINELEAKR